MNGYSADKTSYYVVHDNEGHPVNVPLERHPRLLAIKMRPGRAALSPAGEEVMTALRRAKSQVDFIPHYGIGLYATSERDRAVSVLGQEAAVEFATPVFRQTPGSADPMIATRRFLVQFRPEVTRASVDALNARYGVQVVEELDYAANGYLLEAPPGDGGLGAVALANVYLETGLTLFSHPAFIRTRRFKAVAAPEVRTARDAPATETPVTDRAPQFLAQQWHLTTAKVQDAWNTSRGSRSITIGILDDGFDLGHAEFSGKVAKQFDFASNDADPSPGAGDDHGTACAGVASAAGVKASGAAPDCSLMLVRTPRALGIDDEARMFLWAADNGADVISCSWGPPDGTGNLDPLPDNVRAAINECVKPGGRGRAGKGIPIFFAAGNGSESVSLDGYASNPDVIAVAASTSEETKAWYSDFGPEVWICAPSNGGTRAIITTDRRGAAGYNGMDAALGDPAGDYTNDFGGTSSATPLVAGIAGLMLSVNPALKRNELRQILADTADKIGSGYVDGHSSQFGYGRVNAQRAVEAARNFGGGGGGTGAAASIQGPASVPRSGSAPTFQIRPGANGFYAVEVATRPELFDRAGHGGERTPSNFFASWTTRPYLSTPTYPLPADVWERLRAADRLFYRLWTSASATDWVTHTVSVPDTQGDRAPSIQITAASGGGGGTTTGPSIQGPASAPRSGSAPTFQIRPGANGFYAVEVATRPELFDRAGHGGERTPSNFFASWTTRPYLSTPTYPLPADVWERLRAADRLLYRLWTSASATDWVTHTVSVPDTQGDRAPSIELTGASRTVRDEAGADAHPGPSILGPDVRRRGDPPPTFAIDPGANPFWAMEVTTDWTLFDRDTNEGRRDARNFYGSYREGGLRRADGPTTDSLPEPVWEVLKQAPRLYYRVVTASANTASWPDYETSTPDDAAASAPGIDVLDELEPRAADVVTPEVARREEETRWRSTQ